MQTVVRFKFEVILIPPGILFLIGNEISISEIINQCEMSVKLWKKESALLRFFSLKNGMCKKKSNPFSVSGKDLHWHSTIIIFFIAKKILYLLTGALMS